MDHTQYSLRLRLLTLICIPVIAAGMLAGIAASLFVYHEIDEVYDSEMVHISNVLMQLTGQEITEIDHTPINLGVARPELIHHYEKELSFQIWYRGQLVTTSPSHAAFVSTNYPIGFSDQRNDGIGYRFYVFKDHKTGIIIQIAERKAIRYELMLQILLSLLVPGLFFIPAVAFSVWLGARRALSPLTDLSKAVSRRNASDLVPLEAGHIPLEIAPLITALNLLLSRLGITLQRERELTDNAAHELRTPLAAMKTQLQVLMKHGGMPESERDGIENLLASTNRAASMVNQLMLFSRLQNQEQMHAQVDMSAIVKRVLGDFRPLAEQKRQNLLISITAGIAVQGNEDALEILTRNLIQNALKFTPEGGEIQCNLTSRSGDTVLAIADTGPGIPNQYKDLVFERFYRIDKSRTSGSGLGLAMVKWIAEAHHASLYLKDSLSGGLLVEVSFH